ncbi:salivary glue protein Sgs-3-like, partial [Limulus polyphemus]|uniref:Salivary glue protein Sgs-3-like n=1 Tax=Limulus polyphemus TaxID=6850 RepID=A0ABM1C3N4_LIMPO
SGLEIRPKPCSNDLGEKGTCMFVWDCIQTDGVHLNHCLDGILIGSCCGHNDVANTVPDSVNQDKQSSITTGVSTPSTVTSSVVTKKPFTSSVNTFTVPRVTTAANSLTTIISTTTTTRKPSTTTTTTTRKPSTTPKRTSTPSSFQTTTRIMTRPGISNRKPLDPFK